MLGAKINPGFESEPFAETTVTLPLLPLPTRASNWVLEITVKLLQATPPKRTLLTSNNSLP